ncbi:uncharacterized protein LOC143281524 [Babylonia areolata]|uniref:uncharacterized protein LOC143281524 n=1 Tax=Babylonia areolata TaxID=304850 RepID=UPI003FCF17A4
MNLDGVYGLKVVQGQIQVLLDEHRQGKHASLSPDIVSRLSKALKDSQWVAEQALSAVQNNDGQYFQDMAFLITQPWTLFKKHRRITPSLRWEIPVYRARANSAISEAESDKCMMELRPSNTSNTTTTTQRAGGHGGGGGGGGQPRCRLTENCGLTMTKRGLTEYSITHQILWTALAEMVGCGAEMNALLKKLGFRSADHMQEEFCTNIYYEMLAVVHVYMSGTVKDSYQDIFMEQQFVCPSIGFYEFLKKKYLDQILSWQLPSGCFGENPRAGSSSPDQSPPKRPLSLDSNKRGAYGKWKGAPDVSNLDLRQQQLSQQLKNLQSNSEVDQLTLHLQDSKKDTLDVLHERLQQMESNRGAVADGQSNQVHIDRGRSVVDTNQGKVQQQHPPLLKAVNGLPGSQNKLPVQGGRVAGQKIQVPFSVLRRKEPRQQNSPNPNAGPAQANMAKRGPMKYSDNLNHAPAKHMDNLNHAPAKHMDNLNHAPAKHMDNLNHAPVKHMDNLNHAPAKHMDNLNHAPAKHMDNLNLAPVKHADNLNHAPVKYSDNLNQLEGLSMKHKDNGVNQMGVHNRGEQKQQQKQRSSNARGVGAVVRVRSVPPPVLPADHNQGRLQKSQQAIHKPLMKPYLAGQGSQRKLLMEKAMPGNCLAHKTAVAGGALVMYLRYLIDPGPLNLFAPHDFFPDASRNLLGGDGGDKSNKDVAHFLGEQAQNFAAGGGGGRGSPVKLEPPGFNPQDKEGVDANDDNEEEEEDNDDDDDEEDEYDDKEELYPDARQEAGQQQERKVVHFGANDNPQHRHQDGDYREGEKDEYLDEEEEEGDYIKRVKGDDNTAASPLGKNDAEDDTEYTYYDEDEDDTDRGIIKRHKPPAQPQKGARIRTHNRHKPHPPSIDQVPMDLQDAPPTKTVVVLLSATSLLLIVFMYRFIRKRRVHFRHNSRGSFKL